MSVRVLSWAWNVECASSGEKLVLLALADHAGEDGTCYPSTGALGGKTGLSTSTVRHHLDALEGRAVIERVRRRRRDGKLGTYRYLLAASADRCALDVTGDDDDDQCAPMRSGPAPTHQRRSVAPPAPTGDRSSADPSARVTVTEPLQPFPPGEQLARSPRPAERSEPSSKQRVIAAYVSGYGERRKRRRPPKSWLGALERVTDRALADGGDGGELVTVAGTMGVEGKHPRSLLHVLADYLADTHDDEPDDGCWPDGTPREVFA